MEKFFDYPVNTFLLFIGICAASLVGVLFLMKRAPILKNPEDDSNP